MKYLDYPLLNHLSSTLSTSSSLETKTNVRFEAYSVKPIRQDQKMYNRMEKGYMSEQEEMEELSFSPQMKEAGLSSCFGRLDEKESRKVHFLLVSTLNAAFPDHEFNSLRPDHFTREPNAAVVLSHLNSLLGRGHSSPILQPNSSPSLFPLSTSLSSSPSHAAIGPKTDLYRPLCEVVDLDECEVYSWFPSPEYDPHADVDADNDGDSELGYEDTGYRSTGYNAGNDELLEELEDRMDLDMDGDGVGDNEASWGQAGMELDGDELLGGGVMERNRRRSSAMGGGGGGGGGMARLGSDDEGRRGGGLLWTVNYFFYSKRQKRVLFLTCWCRKRPTFLLSPNPLESAFPAPITASSSFTPPSHTSLPHRTRNRIRHKPLGRPPKKLMKQPSKGDISSLIPIRGMESRQSAAPSSGPGPLGGGSTRLASSAPTPASHWMNKDPAIAQMQMARMTARGFKPTKPPARSFLPAKPPAAMGAAKPSGNIGQEPGGPSSVPPRAARVPGTSVASAINIEEAPVEDRTRKQRSESSTPSLIKAGFEGSGASVASKGKKAKV